MLPGDKQPELDRATNESESVARAAASNEQPLQGRQPEARLKVRVEAKKEPEGPAMKVGHEKEGETEKVARTAKEEQENLLSSSSSVASGSASESSESSCSSVSEDALELAQPTTGGHDADTAAKAAEVSEKAASERLQLAVSLENVSDQQEVLKDPSKRITSDNKQRELDLVAQYEKLNVNSRNSSSSIENDEQRAGS